MIASNMSTLKERLEEALKDSNITKTAIWKACGLSSGAVSQWFSGSTQKIEGENLLNAARVLNVNPDWLATGKGKKQVNSYSVNQEPREYKNEDVIKIPLLAAVGSMGNGNHNQDADFVLDALSITKTWLSKTFPSVMDTNKLRFIHAMGDSMSPTFNDGDILLVDTGINDASIDSIYALEAHDRLFIKRVRRRLDGQFEISSDNPSVKTTDILNGDNEVLIKGRVIWVWNGRRI